MVGCGDGLALLRCSVVGIGTVANIGGLVGVVAVQSWQEVTFGADVSKLLILK